MPGSRSDDRAEPLIFAPVRLTDTAALFIVGPDWPTGDYQLQVTLESDGEEAQQIRSGQPTPVPVIGPLSNRATKRPSAFPQASVHYVSVSSFGKRCYAKDPRIATSLHT